MGWCCEWTKTGQYLFVRVLLFFCFLLFPMKIPFYKPSIGAEETKGKSRQ